MDKTPAPRRTRHDGWTPDRQQRFIEALCYGLTVATTAAMVGMSAGSAYKLRQHPAAAGFRAAWDVAVAPAGGRRGADRLERALTCLTAAVGVDGGGRALRGASTAQVSRTGRRHPQPRQPEVRKTGQDATFGTF